MSELKTRSWSSFGSLVHRGGGGGFPFHHWDVLRVKGRMVASVLSMASSNSERGMSQEQDEGKISWQVGVRPWGLLALSIVSSQLQRTQKCADSSSEGPPKCGTVTWPVFLPLPAFRPFWNSKKPPHLWHGPWIPRGFGICGSVNMSHVDLLVCIPLVKEHEAEKKGNPWGKSTTEDLTFHCCCDVWK